MDEDMKLAMLSQFTDKLDRIIGLLEEVRDSFSSVMFVEDKLDTIIKLLNK